MEEQKFNNWKKLSGLLFILLTIGFVIVFSLPSIESIGVLLIMSAYFGGLAVASKVGFDNKKKWIVFTFLFPYILLLIMYFRKYEKTLISAENKELQDWEIIKSDLVQKVEKIVRLKKKSTISSLMQASRISTEILDGPNNWQPLSDLALNTDINIEVRKEIIPMLLNIENNDIVDEIILRLRNSSDTETKKIINEIDVEEAKLENQEV
jgi:hypothetical protein